MDLSLGMDTATYPSTRGNTVRFYHDASDNQTGNQGAFADISEAIGQARYFIFIAGWSFHPYMRLRRDSAADIKQTLGAQLIRRANADSNLLIAIHTWDHTRIAAADAQNDEGGSSLDSIALQLGYDQNQKRPPNLLWRASSRTGIGWSHHQKFVVLDSPPPPDSDDKRRRLKVFFGGLDLTKGRFDWPEHLILPAQPQTALLRQQVIHEGKMYDDWYNPEFEDNRKLVRQPWHDIHAQLVGPAAWDFLREFVGRWGKDPSSYKAKGDKDAASIRLVLYRFWQLFDSPHTFVQQWESHPGSWNAQVYRSIKKEHWHHPEKITVPYRDKQTTHELVWSLKTDYEASIEAACVKAIQSAQRFIYIETQFLIGSGRLWNRLSVRNRIPETLVERILARARANAPFHVYIVLPMYPEGNPVGTTITIQRYFQWATIAAMIRQLAARLGARWKEYVSFYFMAQWHPVHKLRHSGNRMLRIHHNQRHMIYVHSKFMIVDDELVILGSANLNERSLAGNRDTEIGVGLWPDPAAKRQAFEELRAFRLQLWESYLGEPASSAWIAPESNHCVRVVQQAALSNYICFRRGKRSGKGYLCMWPLHHDTRRSIYVASGARDLTIQDPFIPDALDISGQYSAWRWIINRTGSDVFTAITKRSVLAE
jgi:phospholipase D1/2